MCCFSGPVKHVGDTRIFARWAPGDRQLLAYAMSVEIDTDLAMVLPIPVAPGSGDEAVQFIDLHGYGDFFVDLEKGFPVEMAAQSRSLSFGIPAPRAKLVVHDVGDFVASFVPARRDFVRLDPRFRMSDDVWDRIPGYADWGFAVFQLKPRRSKQRVHPMAFSFPTREPRSLFYPTVHVHDGRVPTEANFDHALFCQADGVLGATLTWQRSSGRIDTWVDASRSRGLIDGERIAFKQSLFDSRPNADFWLREPTGVREDELRGSGDCWAYEIGAYFAYADGPLPENMQRWRETGQTRLGPLARGLREGLAALASSRRARWRLAPIAPDMAPHFMNGNQLWSGRDYMTGSPKIQAGARGVVTFSPFSARVHTQTVRLGFEAIPDADLVAEICRELNALVDRAAFG
jgi:hypothetical protein